MKFERSVLSDAFATFWNAKSFVLLMVFLVPVLKDLISLLFGGSASSSSGTATNVLWAFFMLFSFRCVMTGPAQAFSADKHTWPFMKAWLGMFFFSILFAFAVGLVCLFPFAAFGEADALTSPFFILLLVLVTGLLVHAVLGTWLPAKIIDTNSGARAAFRRARSQGFYVASRLVGYFSPVFVLFLVFVVVATMFNASFDVIDAQNKFRIDGFIVNAIAFGIICFCTILLSVILSRAFVQAELTEGASSQNISLPYGKALG